MNAMQERHDDDRQRAAAPAPEPGRADAGAQRPLAGPAPNVGGAAIGAAAAAAKAGWEPLAGIPRKSPPLACVLSVVPGLGQIYVGYYALGFVHALVVGSLFTLMTVTRDEGLMPLLVVFFIFFMLYNIVDAGRKASLFNQAVDGVPGVELPDASVRLPRAGGSIFGGGLLIVIGLVLLTHTAFDWSIRWVEDWWPLLPIAVGAWLIYRELQDRKASPGGD